jgi:hypothetical protein
VRLVICGLNRKASPTPSTVRLAALASVIECVCWRFLDCLFFPRRSFLISPFAFFGLPLFPLNVFLISPFAFLGLPIFHWRFF